MGRDDGQRDDNYSKQIFGKSILGLFMGGSEVGLGRLFTVKLSLELGKLFLGKGIHHDNFNRDKGSFARAIDTFGGRIV